MPVSPALPLAACPAVDHDTLFELLDGALAAETAAEVERHLDGCDRCRAALAHQSALRAAVARAGRVLAPPFLRARVVGALVRHRPVRR